MSSRPKTRKTSITGTALPGVLVDPSWLRDRLGHPHLRIVDLRSPDEYANGHIPGSAHVDLAGLGSTVDGCDSVLVPREVFAAVMSEAGISSSDAVVAYDDQWGLAAARLVWALHRYGHEAAAALDGGWDRWVGENMAVASGAEAVAPGRFDATPRADVFADTAWIAERIEAGEVMLVDTRSPVEFAGGHLPRAIPWDWFSAVPPGSWNLSRDPEELREEWSRLGLEPSDEVVVYCGSGMRAAHTYLVLKHAGFDRVRLYDGSWQEWSMKAGAKSGAKTGDENGD